MKASSVKQEPLHSVADAAADNVDVMFYSHYDMIRYEVLFLTCTQKLT